MIERLLTVLVSVPVIFACTYFGGLWFFALVAVIATISINELYNLMKKKGFNPYYTLGNLFNLIIITFVYNTIKHPSWEPASTAILTAAVLCCFCAGIFIKRSAHATANISITLLGILYVGWLFSYLVLLRALTPHGEFLFLLMFVVWTADTLAYFIGKQFGKRQLSPYISPKKTIEGAVAGFAGAVIAAVLFGMAYEGTFYPVNIMHYLMIGGFVGIVGQLSDLSESLIKRDAGAKDSSNIIPGHGGVLDRMDSFIFTAPLLYYYITTFFLK
ncbi:MAG: phosphatidate cytidylyltransferase [Candidatus Margulisiibacteriota bacterium]